MPSWHGRQQIDDDQLIICNRNLSAVDYSIIMIIIRGERAVKVVKVEASQCQNV